MEKEIDKLIKLLKSNNIPYEERETWNGSVQVCYPSIENKICDAICFPGTYGYPLLEIMGLVDDEEEDEVEGWLTAEEVYKRMAEHYWLWGDIEI